MKRLHDLCAATKVWKEFAGGTHNDTVACHGYFDAIKAFLEKHVAG